MLIKLSLLHCYQLKHTISFHFYLILLTTLHVQFICTPSYIYPSSAVGRCSVTLLITCNNFNDNLLLHPSKPSA